MTSYPHEEIREQLQLQVGNLNKQINSLSEQAITIKRQMNVLVPVSRLPPEVLSAIFLKLVWKYWVESEYSHEPSYLKDWGWEPPPDLQEFHPVPWIALTYVCHTWRTVALNDPQLWRILNIRIADFHGRRPLRYGPSLINEVLLRSKDLPLTIKLNGNPSIRPTKGDILEPILRNIPRIEGLFCRVDAFLLTQYPEFFSGPYPYLNHFEVYVFSKGPHVAPIFTCNLPRLRKVLLANVALSCVNQFFRAPMKDVVIVYHADFPDLEYLRFVQDLKAGRIFDTLETLNFSMSLPVSALPPVTEDLVEFPNLKSLTITCIYPRELDLLNHILIPPEANISFEMSTPLDWEPTFNDAVAWVHTLSSYLSRTFSKSCTNLYISMLPNCDTHLQITSYTSGPILDLMFNLCGVEVLELIDTVCRLTPFSGVKELFLDDLNLHDVSQCIRVFASMKEVQDVVLGRISCSIFLEALAESCWLPHSVLFPKLRSVEFEEDAIELDLTEAEEQAREEWIQRRCRAGYNFTVSYCGDNDSHESDAPSDDDESEVEEQ